MAKQYWLMKSEPEQFGIADLARVGTEPWTGVRSYFARNHMRAMVVGDEVLFHHSNATPPGVAGLARVVSIGVIDETQFDPASKYHDPKARRDAPIWDCVEVGYVQTLPHFVAMDRLRGEPALADMLVLQRGMRLSVQPVSEAHFETIVRLGHTEPPPEAIGGKPRPAAKPRPTAKPARAKPGAKSAASKATAKPARAKPGAKSAASKPGAKPARAKPGAKPAGAKPAASKPAASKPATRRPARSSAAARRR